MVIFYLGQDKTSVLKNTFAIIIYIINIYIRWFLWVKILQNFYLIFIIIIFFSFNLFFLSDLLILNIDLTKKNYNELSEHQKLKTRLIYFSSMHWWKKKIYICMIHSHFDVTNFKKICKNLFYIKYWYESINQNNLLDF